MPISQRIPTPELAPFIKWAGGKRWLLKYYRDYLPRDLSGHYYEPFLGGASVFLSLRPSTATLSDINSELINVYIQMRDNWEAVRNGLIKLNKAHNSDMYYKIRKSKQRDPIKRAINFIYLNRTCFNGLYRVNQKGEFNVPIGSRSSVVFPGDDFEAIASALKDVDIVVSDFEPIIDLAKQGDFIFADPPYTVLHNNNCFLKYNEVLFSWDDQVRLAKSLIRAKQRGASILTMNANHHSIQTLYSSEFEILIATRASTISASPEKRGKYEELIIRNF